MDTAAPRKKLVRFGPFEADLEQRVLTKNGGRVRLQDQPFRVLTLLLDCAGETISREEVRQRIWPSGTYVEFDDGLNTAIKKIRLALGDAADNPLYIETVPRRGYRFVAPSSYVRTEEEVEQARAPGADLVDPDPVNADLPNQDEVYLVRNPGASSVPSSVPSATVSRLWDRISGRATSRSHRLWLAGTLLLAALSGSFLAITAWHERTNALRSIRSLAVLADAELLWRSHAGIVLATGGNSENLRQVNPNALQDYLQGNHYWALRTDGGLPKAIEYFNRSIAEDPNFARSYAALANCYIVYPMFTGSVSQAVAYPKATEASHKALALDASLPESHLAAAEVALYVDWDFVKAKEEFDRALELSPNYATAHQWYGEFLSLLGRHAEAIREDEIAIQLDPASAVAHHQLGNTYQAARQYDKALVEYQRAIQLSPSYALNYHALMWMQRRQGKYAEAVESLRTVSRLYDGDGADKAISTQLAAAFAKGGRTGMLRKEIELSAEGTRPALFLARDYAELGNKAMAMHWLRRAFALHDIEVLFMNADPEFDGMRSDPDFQALAKAIGFH
jgi:DNA-binding winged helix-turn-helix (wHTH) protein/tetratricopeptide (TPR) repeat protein